MKLLTCKEASESISRRHDHPLTFAERFGLRLHLIVCTGCRNFRNNLQFMRDAMQRYLNQGKDR